jgi:C-terminal processing protease CtpA/Prc
MRKLGTWKRGGIAAFLLLVGLSGSALAQDRDVPWLGVVTQSLSDELREGLDFRGEGVLVSRVVDGGPADRAGVERGDVIASVDGRAIRTPQELTRTIRDSRVGQEISMVVMRDGRRRTLDVRLGHRPEDVPGADTDVLERLPRDLDLETVPRVPRGEGGFVMRGMGRGRLGVRVEDMNDDLGSYFESDGGALVVEVLKDTPAQRAGLKAGDVITRVGDEKITSADDLVEALRGAPAGSVSLTVSRKGQERTLEARLEESPRSLRTLRPGRDMMVLRPRDRRVVSPRTPEARREFRDESEMREEIRRLREELRDLQQKLNQLENEDTDEDQDD